MERDKFWNFANFDSRCVSRDVSSGSQRIAIAIVVDFVFNMEIRIGVSNISHLTRNAYLAFFVERNRGMEQILLVFLFLVEARD